MLEQRLRKGDWVRAVANSPDMDAGVEGVIEGQVTHDMSRTGSALINIIVSHDVTLNINVNFWKVTLLKRNMLPYEPVVRPSFRASEL